MYRVSLLATLLLSVIFATASVAAQDDATRRAEQLKNALERHKGDFDYLLGDWQFTGESRDHGTFSGRWSAVRLEGGQILDEYRVLGKEGETVYVTATIRSYNAAADRWELIGMNPGSGLQDCGTGQRVGPEIHIEQKFGVSGGKATTLRIRYYDIQPDRFSWVADRSVDGGKTWEKNSQTIAAHRIGEVRSLPPLTSAPKP